MVGDDAVRDLVRAVGIGRGRLGAGADQRAHQVDVVVVVLALQHRGEPLQPHAGVDRRARQVDALAARQRLELHEHEVPDLDEAVAVGLGRSRRAARHLLAVIVEDLRARAAGAGVAHRPEIVGGGDADDAALRQPRDFLPEIERLVVVVIDGDGQLVLGEAEVAGDELPGQLDRQRLEIVAEREIAEHLEKRVVARGVADVVEVVVLAAGAHAFLRRRGAMIRPALDAGEDVLELHHAGVGEHQRRIVARHERGRRHDLMAVGPEKLQEMRSDLVDAVHSALPSSLRRGLARARGGPGRRNGARARF